MIEPGVHFLVGLPASGKTSLLSSMADDARSQGWQNVIYAPGDGRWNLKSDILCDTFSELRDCMDNLVHICIIIDEAFLLLEPRYYSRYIFAACHGWRHMDLILVMGTQRPYDIDPSFRDLMTRLYTFRMGEDSCKWLRGYEFIDDPDRYKYSRGEGYPRHTYCVYDREEGLFLGQFKTEPL